MRGTASSGASAAFAAKDAPQFEIADTAEDLGN